MKKSFRNFLLLTTAVSVVATGALMILESLLGPADLFVGCTTVVMLVGLAVTAKQVVS